MQQLDITLSEWSCAGPGEFEGLRGAELTDTDRAFLAGLDGRALQVSELKAGLKICSQHFVGTVQLSGLRISIVPKLGLQNVLGMVAFAHSIPVSRYDRLAGYQRSSEGLADLLAEAYLRQVETLARRGLSARYQAQEEHLTSPRGRICMRSAATRVGTVAVKCRYDEYNTDHALNRALAQGLRLASRVVLDRELGFQLLRARDRLFGELEPVSLGPHQLAELLCGLDRSTSHYRPALSLLQLLVEGCRLQQHVPAGEAIQLSFLLDMNLLFERFLESYFRQTAPRYYQVLTQSSHSEHFSYSENPRRWNRPVMRPDLLFSRSGQIIAVGDAKYKDRVGKGIESSELYQLTVYGMSFARRVFLFHPLDLGQGDRPAKLEYSPLHSPSVSIEVVGVPVDDILKDGLESWRVWEKILENQGP